MLRGLRVSLANKCQLLFGLAVVLILGAALTVAGWRMERLVQRGPQRRAQDLADLYVAGQIDFAALGQASAEGQGTGEVDSSGVILTRVDAADFESVATTNPFLATAIERFEATPDVREVFEPAEDRDGRLFFRYARAIRGGTSELSADADTGTGLLSDPSDSGVTVPEESTPGEVARASEANDSDNLTQAAAPAADPLDAVLLIQLRDDEVWTQQTLNRIYTIAAWLVAGVLAIFVFWFILTRLILSPVRVLRGYALRVSEGDLSIRSDINTGDEFEQLSEVFNTMLETLKSKQDQLSAVNKSLDLKLGEMAESNVALYEANKIKGEFLANVSHELRTPLNSIIGFAEVLAETLADRTGPIDEKRKRYANNIIHSSRQLLDLITELLDLAKIEAGRMEVHVSTVSVRDTCEGLVSLMTPQAQKNGVRLRLDVPNNLPMIETDPGKLQQILFNFLSNAVKFTPSGGTVMLSAEAIEPEMHRRRAMVRLAVSDTGPGIAPEDHDRIFEKFTQLAPTETRQHGGTGLGLTISAELADLLRGRIELDSAPGQGATFALKLPVVFYRPDEKGPELSGSADDARDNGVDFTENQADHGTPPASDASEPSSPVAHAPGSVPEPPR